MPRVCPARGGQGLCHHAGPQTRAEGDGRCGLQIWPSAPQGPGQLTYTPGCHAFHLTSVHAFWQLWAQCQPGLEPKLAPCPCAHTWLASCADRLAPWAPVSTPQMGLPSAGPGRRRGPGEARPGARTRHRFGYDQVSGHVDVAREGVGPNSRGEATKMHCHPAQGAEVVVPGPVPQANLSSVT